MIPRLHVVLAVAVLTVAGLAAAATAPANDRIASAEAMVVLPTYHDERDTTGATLEDGEPRPCDHMDATVWYRLDVAGGGAGWVDVDTGGSDFDTVLAVYAGDDVDDLTLVACNDDSVGYGLQSRVIFFADLGTTYHVQVAGYLAKTGTLHLNAQHTWAHPCDSGPLAASC